MSNDKVLSIIVRAQDQASKVMAQVGDKMEAVGQKIAAAAKVATVAVAAMATAFSVNAVKSAIDLGESVNAVQKTFGDASKKIFEFGKVAADQAGLSQAAFAKAVVPIGAMLQNMGFEQDKAADSSINLGKRAADLASVFNTSLDEALTAIQAGLRGEADPLEKFGVGLSQTNVEAYALAKGIVKTGQEMTAAQGATARLGLFMEQTSRFAGDFASTADEAANKQRILTARFENQSAVIGQKLLPVWEWMLNLGDRLITDVFPKIESIITLTSGAFAQFWPQIVAVAQAVGNYLLPKFNELWQSIQTNIIPILKDLWHNVIEPLLPVLGTALVGAIGLVTQGLKLLFDGIGWVYQAFKEGNPVVLGLAAVFGTLAAAMAFNAVFNALTVGFATLQLITIPSVMASVTALRTLIATPLVFGAIAVGAAVAAMFLIEQAANRARAAVDQAQSAQESLAAERAKITARFKDVMNDPNSTPEKKALWQNAMRNIGRGYSSGGYTGRGGTNEVAGLVHRGEYVVPKSQVDQTTGQPKVGGGVTVNVNMLGAVNVGSQNDIEQLARRIGSILNGQKELGSYGAGI